MNTLFLLLFLISFICLIAGLVKPTAFSRFIKGEITRKKIGLIFGVSTFAFLVIFGLTAGTESDKSSTQQVEPKIQESIKEQQGQDSVKEERRKALEMVLEYQLQKDLEVSSIDKTTTLQRAFQIMTQDKILDPSTGWFSVKEGDRTVVGWKGFKVGQVHIPQWQVKDNNITFLNGAAGTYTPELEPATPDITGVSEQEKKLYDRFNTIIDKEIMPEWNRRIDATDVSGWAEVNEWYDEQENIVMARVAKEFNVSTEEADRIYLKVANREVDRGEEFAQSRGKILSAEEIDKLLQEQGKLE